LLPSKVKSRKSISFGPVEILKASLLKSATLLFTTLFFVPLPLLIATLKSLTAMVNPSTPTNDASPTVAVKAVQLLESVVCPPPTGALGFIKAIAKSTLAKDRPMAASLVSPVSMLPFPLISVQ